MKRKLIWLNVALAGLIAAAGYKVSFEWSEQKKREETIRSNKVKSPSVKPVTVPPAPPSVTAASYSEIANKMLFSKERNPTVVVEAPIAPPPRPMPPLPMLHGVMGLPSGVLALMSVKANTRAMAVHVGEKIGEFELAGLTRDEISLKWEDKTVTKSVSEMIYHTQEQATASQPAQPAASANAPAALSSSGGAKPANENNPADTAYKNCSAGDNSPAGTIADGYRKVLRPTPFGNSCSWELLK